mmetsp:Transcript_59859/g.157378  ORF Transcript_59859/g.157378 Transcript_59859/m.157378 type:complete len:170 (+) Transcript_59859:1-510(+)
MYNALEGRFGPLRRPMLERAKLMAAEALEKKAKDEAKANVPKSSRGSEGQRIPRDKAFVGADRDENKRARVETQVDVEWAVAILAPWGFREGSENVAVLTPPGSIVLPVLCGLQDLDKRAQFRELLRNTKIGKAVSSMRHHKNPEVAKMAKDLVGRWKSTATRRERPTA